LSSDSKRVHFRERQTLRRDDLADDQAHRIKARRRHNIAQHSWGIVRGLALAEDARGVLLTPGVAIDGYGRELVVPEAVLVETSMLQRLVEGGATAAYAEQAGAVDGNAIDVWLNFRVRTHAPDAQDIAVESFRGTARTCEEAWIRLECADAGTEVDPYRPPGVPLADLAFPPTAVLPLDSDQVWPVYLGRILIEAAGHHLPTVTLPEVALAYAGLEGAVITSPWHDTWMQVGRSDMSDRYRFAFALPDAAGASVRRLALDRDGNAVLRGVTRILRDSGATGNLTLAPAAEDAPASPAFGFDMPKGAPLPAQPWRLYPAALQRDGSDVRQLRFEISNPGKEGDPALSQWVVGVSRGASGFSPTLEVRADNTVIMRADVSLEGRLVEGPIPLDFNDPRFRDELLSRWTKGLTTASREVDAYYAVVLSLGLAFNGVEPGPAVHLARNTDLVVTVLVRNVSRDLTIKILRAALKVEYYDTGSIQNTLMPLQPGDSDGIATGEDKTLTMQHFQFVHAAATKGKVTVVLNVSGIAQNAVDVEKSYDVEFD
jgi:hypothetical protein